MSRLFDPILCTGCSSCAQICPHGCITMKPDSEGFRRPVVDESRCTDCGACAAACPVLRRPASPSLPVAYAAKTAMKASAR